MTETIAMTTKSLRATYWIVTLIFAVLMGWSAVQYLIEAPGMTEAITGLGYPIYFMKILGVAKLLGIAAILFGRYSTLKEWAYAGFTFDTLGAFASHLAHGDGLGTALIPLAFCAALFVSYFLWKRLAMEPEWAPEKERMPSIPASSPQSRPRTA
jgi:DoxX-like family